MVHRRSKPLIVLCTLGVCAYFLIACGGRYRTVQEVFDDEPTAGASSGGASNGRAGSGTGGAGRAGSGNVGKAGSGTAGGVSCDQVKCGMPGCGPGSQPVIPPGKCCAVCMVDPGACMKGQAAYAMDRDAIGAKTSYGCNRDSECRVVEPTNACEPGCGALPVLVGSAEYLLGSLEYSAEQYCSTCPPVDVPPCVPPAAVHCVGGQCAFIE